MFESLPQSLQDTASQERVFIAAAVAAQLDVGRTPELTADSANLLRGLLDDPGALREAGYEKPVAAGLMWRLGAAQGMSRVVLKSIANLTAIDPDLLRNNQFLQSKTLACDLLRAHPRLLAEATPEDMKKFWQLIGYDPAEDDGSDSARVLDTLSVLQHATFIPEALITQMRHHRDHPTTINPEPQLPAVDDDLNMTLYALDKREQELTEVSTRAMLGTFVAQYTGDVSDHHIASTALEAFADCALIDALGLEEALEVLERLESMSPKDQGIDATAFLRQRINSFLPNFDLTDMPLGQLAWFTRKIKLFANDNPSPQTDSFLANMRTRLEEYELLYAIGEDPHLSSPTAFSQYSAPEVTFAEHAQRSLRETLALLRHETPTVPNALDVITQEFETLGFTPKLVREAFTLVASELDQTTKDALTAHFDTIIGGALRRLEPEHKLSAPNALSELVRIDMGALAYFASGRRYMDERTRAFAQLTYEQLTEPDSWLHQQKYHDFTAAGWLEKLHDALWYNRDYYRETSPDKLETIKQVEATYDKILDFIDVETAHVGTRVILERSSRRLAILIRGAGAATSNTPPTTNTHAPQPSTPLGRLLAYYRNPIAF